MTTDSIQKAVQALVDPKPEVEYMDLTNESALLLALPAERENSARLQLENREAQLQATLALVNNEYQENGKYRVLEVNVDKRKVGRVLV